MTTAIERRRDAAQATLDRFGDKPFEWGKHDCARMVAFHLRKMGKPVKIAKAGSYRSAKSAQAALKRLGHKTLIEFMDAHFARIPPAAAALGDVVAGPPDHAVGALCVCLGNGRVVGYHESMPGAVVLQPVKITAAWRI